MQLPDHDFSLSPITGYTRAHWEAAADGLLAGVRPYFDASGALVRLPGRTSASGSESDGLEGFARTFLLAAIRVAGAGGDDPNGLLAPYADGLVEGPRGAWLPITDRAQPMVESASIAIALHLTKPWLWDKLDAGTRERLTEWLSGALTHRPVDNNWMLFPIPVADFLSAAGVPHDDAAVERGLSRLEEFYVGGGWYRDGERRSFDHYNGWALHLYPNLREYLFASSTPPAPDPLINRDAPAGQGQTGTQSRSAAPASLAPNFSEVGWSAPELGGPEARASASTSASDEAAVGIPGAPSSSPTPGAGAIRTGLTHPGTSEQGASPATRGAAADPTTPSPLLGIGTNDRYRARLREFLFGYAEWFGSDGAPLFFGRSLTYRMAAAASLWLGALVDATPLSPGRTRRIASGALRYFLEHGAVSDDGLLTMGWHGPHEATLQWYSGAASPYWASKGFLGLLLPPDHPVWTSVEEDGPDEATRVMPQPGLLVHRHGGIARLINHGSDDIPWTAPPPGDPHPQGDDPLYARLAYSTVTGPTHAEDIPDNHFGLVFGDRMTARGPITPATSATIEAAIKACASATSIPSLPEPHEPASSGAESDGGTSLSTPATSAPVPGAATSLPLDPGIAPALRTEDHRDAQTNKRSAPCADEAASSTGSDDTTDRTHERFEAETQSVAFGQSGTETSVPASLGSVHVPQLDGVPVPGARVASMSAIEDGREVRTHVVWAVPGTVVRQTGWAVPGGESDNSPERPAKTFETTNRTLVSRLKAVCGWSHGGTLDAPSGTAYGPHAVVPYLEGVVRESPAMFVCEVELHDVRFGENEHKRSAGA
ncbi:DUF2264 domain-containing protein [Actinomadura gamaensis]|uniref:DUF2264 domain-containing protein n=1 Tax=Actinomadura gamaensis TaxID=1763541 RepID=A0ABV9TXD4_9ACTN